MRHARPAIEGTTRGYGPAKGLGWLAALAVAALALTGCDGDDPPAAAGGEQTPAVAKPGQVGHLHIAAASFTLTKTDSDAKMTITMSADGSIRADGSPRGSITSGGRALLDGGTVGTIAKDGTVDAAGKNTEPISVAPNGSVDMHGESFLVIADDGTVTGSGVAAFGGPTQMRYEGPPEARRALVFAFVALFVYAD